MTDNNNNSNIFVRVLGTLWRWTKRMFLGASKELTLEEKLAAQKR